MERIALHVEQHNGWAVCDVPDHDGWLVIMRFNMVSGDTRLLELTLAPEAEDNPIGTTTTGELGFARRREPLGEVTTRMLRRTPVRKVRALVEAETVDMGGSLTPTSGSLAHEVGEEPTIRRPGRPSRPDRDYATWAARYVERLAAGSSAPVKELAHDADMNPSQVRAMLHEARQRGLLTQTPQGRAGGELTPKAAQLLQHNPRKVS